MVSLPLSFGAAKLAAFCRKNTSPRQSAAFGDLGITPDPGPIAQAAGRGTRERGIAEWLYEARDPGRSRLSPGPKDRAEVGEELENMPLQGALPGPTQGFVSPKLTVDLLLLKVMLNHISGRPKKIPNCPGTRVDSAVLWCCLLLAHISN